ncbi:MAG: hypothetical protein RJB61_1296, partial [Actinomycetota bacterium]
RTDRVVVRIAIDRTLCSSALSSRT